MKYRLLGFGVCLFALSLSVAAPVFEYGTEKRVHQHREAQAAAEEAQKTETRSKIAEPEINVAKTEETDADGTFSTHLPLVELDTGGVSIPGKAILDDKGMAVSCTTARDGASSITAHMDIVDHEAGYNRAGDTPLVSTDVEIHVRGSSSRAFDKSSYFIRLKNADGSNNPQEIMGMDTHHEWVLYGPYLDKTLIRNYMWYNIGGEIMDYAPNVRFCEVMLNGEYQGVYVMLENITAGKDGARLNVSVSAKNNTFTGYILRLDEGNKAAIKEVNHFTSYAERTRQKLDIIYPGTRNLTPELARAIARDFSDFEKALYSYDYDNEKYGYDTWIDTRSFIDYFLINEFVCNYDAGGLSIYIYKDVSGKFRMCLWDLNSSCDNYQYSQTEPMCFQMQNCLWYFMLMKDEDFTGALIDRYWELRKSFFSEEYLNRYIDETVAYLGDAVDRNYKVWGYSFGEEYDMLLPRDRNPRSYGEAIGQLKDFFARRIAWMDENIDTLRQYSAESKVKKFNENAN